MKSTRFLTSIFLFTSINIFAQSPIDSLRHQLVVERASKKAGKIFDPQLSALLAKQIYDFYRQYGDQNGSMDGTIQSLIYDSYMGLLRVEQLTTNPIVEEGLAVFRADSAVNQYHGHKPRSKDDRTVAVRSVEFTHDGKSFYSAGGDGKLLKWDYQSRAYDVIYESDKSDRVVHISPDERWLALATNEDEIDVFDLSDLNKKPNALKGHRGSIYDLVFLPDNSGFVSIGADRRLLFSDFKTESEIANVSSPIRALAISTNSRTLAGGANNGQIFLYDITDGTSGPKEIYRKNQSNYPVQDLSFSPDGKLLAIAGFNLESGLGFVQIWAMEKNQPFGPELGGFESIVNSVKFSPDGKYLAGASKDKTVRVWEVDPDRIFNEPLVFDDHIDWVWDISFHPDGKSLLTAGADGIIRSFSMSPDAMANRLCDKITRNLSQEEWRQFFGKTEDIPYQETCPGKPVSEE